MKFKDWLNVRTASFIFWAVLSIVMILTMPNLDELVREKGQVTMPEYVQSMIADEILTEMETDGTENYQFIAVFHSDEKLTVEQKKEIDNVIETFRQKQDELGITSILAYNESEETEKQLVAKDGTTVLTQIAVNTEQGTAEEVASSLRKLAKTEKVDTYFTGTDIVLDDFAKSSQEGIKKTEIIAVIFILIVLVLVFRSPVVPLVSLLTVGVSYIVSLSIVTQLVKHFDYPFSTFTQVFLIVILFGIGTDYNILLYTRFKEEVSKGGHILKAITETYRTAGKTVIYSGIAVFIGFMALYLSEFQLYRATSAVAIGVAVLLLVLITLNPFFMAVLGFKLFWPVKKVTGHNENKLWATLSKLSFFHPIAAIAIVAIICVPLILKNSGDLNYNDLVEINDKYESKQAIKVIEKHFPAGFSAPTNLAIQWDESLATQKALQDIDKLVDTISKVKGVSEVYSVTRPAGEKIQELYVKDQANTLTEGLGDANEGISQIHEGLSSAENELGKVDKNKFNSVQTLIDGTAEMKNGIGQLSDALSKVSKGFEDGADGAKQLKEGLGLLKDNVSKFYDGATKLQKGYSELEKGFSSFSTVFTTVTQAAQGMNGAFASIESSLNAAIESNQALSSDQNILTALGTAKTGKEQTEQLLTNLNSITPKYNEAVTSFKTANESMSQITTGLKEMKAGISQLQNGAAALEKGLKSGVEGTNTINSKTALLQDGIDRINDGQKQLQSGLSSLQEQMELLQSGLGESTEGLSQISEGLVSAQDYLTELTDSTDEIFYIPKEVLEGDEFAKSLDMYMSEDRRTTKIMIILDENPYTKDAMTIMEEVDDQIKATSKTLSFKDAKIALGGKTIGNVDLEEISNGDFMRTLVIMIVGIGLVLLVITRSFWQTVVIIASLIVAYLASLGASQMISEHIIGQPMFSWTVPFFSFIMIVTLGVDYSIFLMMRYLENAQKGYETIMDASKHIGGVVISAAVILGGTFAALYPSGIVTLLQVATIVIVGLVLLSIIMLPVFLPATFGFTDKVVKFFTRKKE